MLIDAIRTSRNDWIFGILHSQISGYVVVLELEPPNNNTLLLSAQNLSNSFCSSRWGSGWAYFEPYGIIYVIAQINSS